MKVYGIKTCGSVKKAVKFFNDRGIEYEFVDFKKTPVGCEKIDEWIQKVGIEKLFNNRGTKYRQLGLKDLGLDDEGRRQWLCKENLLIKRPVVELDDQRVIVGFDEKLYEEIFG